MNALPLEELLSPLSEGAPCGPDLEHDSEFRALDKEAQGQPERQAGSEILPAEPPLWPEVLEKALALARRTRDLRVAVLIARASAHVDGVAGYAAGLGLIAGLLEHYWAQVHPMLDAEDHNDPTMRLNALAPLSDFSTGMTDFRSAFIGDRKGGVRVREVELAWGRADPSAGETRPDRDGLTQGLRTLLQARPAHAQALAQIDKSVAQIEQVVAERVGVAGPDLAPLRRLAQTLKRAGEAAKAEDSQVPSQEEGTPMAAQSATVTPAGPIRTREDASRVLDQVCAWIEKQEPTNPAPLLIRRAQRVMTMSFMEIMHDLAPNGVREIETLAGSPKP